MKLHVLSDLHRDLAGDITIPALDADVVILAGDIDEGFDSIRWAARTFTRPTLLVLGNHEIVAGNEKKLARFRELAEGTAITILENDVLKHGGVRFLGCSLWAPMNDRMCTTMDNSIVWLRETLAQAYDGKTVVITHYPPLRRSLGSEILSDNDLARRMSADLTGLIDACDISLWVHGHIHIRQDYYYYGGTRIVCNPRGYADMVEPMFDPGYSIEA